MFIVTLGLPGSASTWLWNVVRSILSSSRPGAVALFAEDIGRLASHVPPGTTDMVLKAHSLDAALTRVVQLGGARVIVTVRDPRDGVLSLAERFGTSYPELVRHMARSLATLGTLAQTMPLTALRYEDGFAERPYLNLARGRWSFCMRLQVSGLRTPGLETVN